MQSWLFLFASIFLIWVSRKSLLAPRSHGFFRFFAWEAITLMIVRNLSNWFYQPFSWHQIISWLLLVLSLPVAISGVLQLKRLGRPDTTRQDDTLIGMEKTTQLITMGVFRFIRHPLYTSLLLLALGVFFKQITWANTILTTLAVIFLTITAKIEERENIAYFGAMYQEYQAKSKMFIPFIF